jgi:hypothetical protein
MRFKRNGIICPLVLALIISQKVVPIRASVIPISPGCKLAASKDPSLDYSVDYSAICAVVKNENRYIREWVLYHLCLGT